MDLFSSLNRAQKDAVLHEKGPLLILAGAGSGKTRVITHRIAHLIQNCGVSPYRILAITFTNKAAREMQERVSALLEEGEDVWVSTFHSTCVRMLRKFCTSIGYDRNFVIYDTDDQKRVMKDVIKHLNIDPKKLSPKTILGAISKAKNEMIGPDEFFGTAGNRDIARAYKEYQDVLMKNNAFDFDDLLLKTVELFQTDREALGYYQNRFEYILVDEYQDTNAAQFELIRLLANHINDDGEPEHNLCVVGDDDQSIYKFRGADIRNILDFERYFPDTTVIKLEQNYRSTKRILNAANSVIANNMGRKVKALWSDNEEGDLITLTEYLNDLSEANSIVADIANAVQNGSGQYRDYAILYRTNAQSRVFEERFVNRGIPYKLVGGTNFYERMEIRDILAYLRTIDNSNDTMAIKRIINVPKRGIGDTTMDKIDDYAYVKDIPLYDALERAASVPGVSSRTANNIEHFLAIIGELRSLAASSVSAMSSLIDDILEMTGYDTDLKDQDPERYDDRMDNINELKNKIAQYLETAETPSLSGFLAEVALVADVDSVDNDADYVILMTLHSAKGLEFDHVYISGLEEGLFPSQMSIDSEHPDLEIEEERRLCYVGITRARKTLNLSYAKQRMMRGETQFNRVSRFVNELPRDIIRKRTEGAGNSGWADRTSSRFGTSYGSRGDSYSGTSYGSRGGSHSGSSYSGSSYGSRDGSYSDSSYSGSSYGRNRDFSLDDLPVHSGSGASLSDLLQKKRSTSASAGSSYQNPYTQKAPAAAPISSDGPGYGVGDRVKHVKFGVGTVTELTRGARDYEVTVEFAAGTKKMLAAFAKLVKVD